MKYKEIVIVNVLACLALIAEVVLIASGFALAACIMAGVVAVIAFVLFIVHRSGEHVVSTAANIGYALAIICGTIANYYVGGLSVLLWGGIGIATLLLQIGLTLAYKEGRL